MKKKEIKNIAEKIMALELDIELGKNVKFAEQEIVDIMSTLSVFDAFDVDEYIQLNWDEYKYKNI